MTGRRSPNCSSTASWSASRSETVTSSPETMAATLRVPARRSSRIPRVTQRSHSLRTPAAAAPTDDHEGDGEHDDGQRRGHDPDQHGVVGRAARGGRRARAGSSRPRSSRGRRTWRRGSARAAGRFVPGGATTACRSGRRRGRCRAPGSRAPGSRAARAPRPSRRRARRSSRPGTRCRSRGDQAVPRQRLRARRA